MRAARRARARPASIASSARGGSPPSAGSIAVRPGGDRGAQPQRQDAEGRRVAAQQGGQLGERGRPHGGVVVADRVQVAQARDRLAREPLGAQRAEVGGAVVAHPRHHLEPGTAAVGDQPQVEPRTRRPAAVARRAQALDEARSRAGGRRTPSRRSRGRSSRAARARARSAARACRPGRSTSAPGGAGWPPCRRTGRCPRGRASRRRPARSGRSSASASLYEWRAPPRPPKATARSRVSTPRSASMPMSRTSTSAVASASGQRPVRRPDDRLGPLRQGAEVVAGDAAVEETPGEHQRVEPGLGEVAPPQAAALVVEEAQVERGVVGDEHVLAGEGRRTRPAPPRSPGLAATMASSIPVRSVTTGGIGRPGLTRVAEALLHVAAPGSGRRRSRSPSSARARRRWSPGRRRRRSACGQLGAGPVRRREPHQVAPEPGQPRVALDDLGDQPALQALGAAAQPQELGRDVARPRAAGPGARAARRGGRAGSRRPRHRAGVRGVAGGVASRWTPAIDSNGGLRRHRSPLGAREFRVARATALAGVFTPSDGRYILARVLRCRRCVNSRLVTPLR